MTGWREDEVCRCYRATSAAWRESVLRLQAWIDQQPSSPPKQKTAARTRSRDAPHQPPGLAASKRLVPTALAVRANILSLVRPRQPRCATPKYLLLLPFAAA